VSGKLPIIEPEESLFHHPGQWWHADGDRIVCDLCPRECSLNDGARGFCFVRQNIGGRMALTTYGRSTGFCIDPIEKKPLNHFYPGTSVLSFGTAGCNLGCRFCQNWDISKSREVERLSSQAFPEDIARAALSLECRSVAFTYNDPIIWAEYAIDTARACRAMGIRSVAVTAGYITEEAREPFFSQMDAANVDLKAFTEEFYHKITASHLQPVLDTLRWLKHETDVWLEITNLIIPDANDSADELKQMCEWLIEAVGAEVPVHFSGFHPDYRMMDRGDTPAETLNMAREIAIAAGLQYVYTGNVNDHERQSTFCPNCKTIVIERDRYSLGVYNLDGSRCRNCAHKISGHFDAAPGTWGARRLPVDMRPFASPISTTGGKPMTPSQIQLDELTELSAEHSHALLQAAATFLADSSVGTQTKLTDPTIHGLGQSSIYGTFVTARRNGALRSCCGTLGKPMPLAESLQKSAHRTATDDPRFPPITARELEDLDIEVWLLKSPERIDGPAAERNQHVKVGVHGLQVLRGKNRGLLLPGVPVEHHWTEEEFLNQTCKKAGLAPNAWRDDATTVLRFEGLSCASRLRETGIEIPIVESTKPFSAPEFAQYCQHCRSSLETLLSGGVPMYYLPQVSDAEVNGVILTANVPGTDQDLTISRLSVKQQFPFQSTLFSLCEDAARVISRGDRRLSDYKIGLTIVSEPSMLGPVNDVNVQSVDTAECGLLVIHGNQTGFAFDPTISAADVLADTLNAAGLDSKAAAGTVFSLAIQSDQDRVVFGQKPQAVEGASVRPPAVAGTFYPAQADALIEQVDGFLGSSVSQPKQRWAACMVPHAGLRYSGQLAADVLSRIELPELIIAIGPKHTPHGVNWAVAPHEQWSTPLGNIASDPRVVAALVAAIPGLEPDSAAHAGEHAIEVELPLIQRLSPNSRVVGIAIGSGDFDQCDQFATGLAKVVQQLATPPLLLISSDMNHFANESETHRLDELALTKIDQLDAAGLLETVRSNHISMCGVLPAVIVMQTLQRLGKLTTSLRVGSTTSAAVSGDTLRVVGYAGVLLN
jgi:AmmeMemoRadiSam system radical SAM enzyme/AmmeMemoRadiSam system protein B/uncharacterized protein (TIGR00296 family)